MKQKQSQKVIVNIGTAVARRRRRRRRKAPSSQVNIQPIVLPPQTDYTPILTAMLNHQTNSIRTPPIPQNTPTPVSLSSRPPASLMAGLEAQRRAGPTADRFQPMPSQADERFSMAREDIRVRPPDPVYTERLVKGPQMQGPEMLIGAEATKKKGRPLNPANITVGEPVTGDIFVGFRQGSGPSDPQHTTGQKLIEETGVSKRSKSRTRATKAQITERRAMGAEDKPIVSPPTPRGRTLIKKKKPPRSRSTQ